MAEPFFSQDFHQAISYAYCGHPDYAKTIPPQYCHKVAYLATDDHLFHHGIMHSVHRLTLHGTHLPEKAFGQGIAYYNLE